MRPQVLATTAFIVAVSAVLGLLLVASETDALVAFGSDAGVEIFRPELWSKLLAVTASWLSWLWAVFGKSNAWIRGSTCAAANLAVVMATHAIVLNHRHGTIEEHWLLVKRVRAEYNLQEGPGYDWRADESCLGLTLTARKSTRSVFLFEGVPPWQLRLEQRFGTEQRREHPNAKRPASAR